MESTLFLDELGDLPLPAQAALLRVLAAMVRYDWPVNIREMEQCLAAALVLAGPERIIDLDHLPARVVRGPRAGEEAAGESDEARRERIATGWHWHCNMRGI